MSQAHAFAVESATSDTNIPGARSELPDMPDQRMATTTATAREKEEKRREKGKRNGRSSTGTGIGTGMGVAGEGDRGRGITKRTRVDIELERASTPHISTNMYGIAVASNSRNRRFREWESDGGREPESVPHPPQRKPSLDLDLRPSFEENREIFARTLDPADTDEVGASAFGGANVV